MTASAPLRAWCLTIIVIAASSLGAGRARAGDAPATVPNGGGMRMYLDPQTGALGSPPSAAFKAVNSPTNQATTAGTAPLVAEPLNGPAGGVKVNLQGRFRAAVTRRADSAGVQHECVETSVPPQ